MGSALKNTKQRCAIMSALEQSPFPVTAEELAEKVCRAVPGIALSTIYRNLERLCDAGQINRLVFEDGVARYETPGAVHGHYLICTGCSKKVRIEECPLSELSKKLEQDTGFSVLGHNLQLYGLCPECRKSTEKKHHS